MKIIVILDKMHTEPLHLMPQEIQLNVNWIL